MNVFKIIHEKLVPSVVLVALVGAILKTTLGCSPAAELGPGNTIRVVIPKGSHEAVGVRIKNSKLRVSFEPTCRYTLTGDDQIDINKLFGVGFLNGLRNHRWLSARWGWYYEPQSDRIILAAYSYKAGNRSIKELAKMGIGEVVELGLNITERGFEYSIEGEVVHVEEVEVKGMAYPLGVYFGGNQKAPHTMHINFTQL